MKNICISLNKNFREIKISQNLQRVYEMILKTLVIFHIRKVEVRLRHTFSDCNNAALKSCIITPSWFIPFKMFSFSVFLNRFVFKNRSKLRKQPILSILWRLHFSTWVNLLARLLYFNQAYTLVTLHKFGSAQLASIYGAFLYQYLFYFTDSLPRPACDNLQTFYDALCQ